ncbi:MAG: DMT family transporter [Cypionkella sp.]
MDGVGLAALIAVTFLLAVNQIAVKEVNRGLQPMFFAGARSALAIVFVYAWMKYRGLWGRIRWADLDPDLAIGAVFAAEFFCLFMALDLTAVSRASMIFYTMPLWLAVAAHFWRPNERITPKRGIGLGLAFIGTA